MRSMYWQRIQERGISYVKQIEGRLTGLVTSGVRTVFIAGNIREKLTRKET